MNEPGDSNEVHYELFTILSQSNDRFLSFETLPFALKPIQRDGNHIGITKKALIQAFLQARTTFFNCLLGKDHGEGVDSYPEAILTTTAIILLYDSEFLTAVNWRKKWLLDQVEKGNDEITAESISRELLLSASLLHSPMHRTAKSPTLWYHRLWIWELVFEEQRGGGNGGGRGLLSWISSRTQEANWGFQSEMKEYAEKAAALTRGDGHDDTVKDILRIWSYETVLAQKAGENHPNNYYAWKHLRHIFHSIKKTLLSLSSVVATPLPPTTVEKLLAELTLPQTHAWCLHHPRDISGWSFLQFLLRHVHDLRKRRECVQETIDHARRIGWEGEGLWRFVDGVCEEYAGDGIGMQAGGQDEAFTKALGEYDDDEEDEDDGRVVTVEVNRWRRWLGQTLVESE